MKIHENQSLSAECRVTNLGYILSDQTVGNILKRNGIPPAPEQENTTTWKEFIRTHMEVLVATDFFTAEVWTLGGLLTCYVLFFIHLGSRNVHVSGVTPHPNAQWMMQVAGNVTMDEWCFLSPGQYLIHDRDKKFCPAFQRLIDEAGVKCVLLPPRSPNLNAYAERWVRSVKEEALSRLILFGKNPSTTCLPSMSNIIIGNAITRGNARRSLCLQKAKTTSVKVRFSAGNDLEDSSNTTTEKLHEFFDHTRWQAAINDPGERQCVLAPAEASGVSLSNDCLVHGLTEEKALEIGKDSVALFQKMLDAGLRPAELQQSPLKRSSAS
jgi:hypothetical protein